VFDTKQKLILFGALVKLVKMQDFYSIFEHYIFIPYIDIIFKTIQYIFVCEVKKQNSKTPKKLLDVNY